jgi:hypothetical protein
MPRDLSSLPVLTTVAAALAALREDPADRFIDMSDDLCLDDWDDCSGTATRCSPSLYIVTSLKAMGAATFAEAVQIYRSRHYEAYGVWPGEIALIAEAVARELTFEAEEGYADRRISRASFADLWVLPEHPEAETDAEVIKQYGFLPVRPQTAAAGTAHQVEALQPAPRSCPVVVGPGA